MRSLILGSVSAAAAIGHHSLDEPAVVAGQQNSENTKRQAPGSNACLLAVISTRQPGGHQVGARAPLPFSVCAVGYPTMSSLWTPGGERPVEREPRPSSSEPPGPAQGEPTEEEIRAQLEELRMQLAETPPEVIIANHAFGLFELAAVHLSLQPPQLEQARLAIDGFAALVEGLQGRLGDAEQQLQDGLAQLRMAFVQIRGAGAGGPPSGPDG